MKKLALILAAATAFTACSVNYEKTKSGFQYKIIKGKGGDSLKPGQFMKFDLIYKVNVNGKDSVLNSTYGKFPAYSGIDTGARANYSFMEVLPKCTVGDSIVFNLSVDTLKKLGAIPEYNKTFPRGGQIHGSVKILKVFKDEAAIKADYEAEMEATKKKEVDALEQYLAKKGVKAQKTKNGAFVEIEVAGDQALKADSGKQVTMMYKGYLQEDNKKVFDTNMDSSKHHTDPLVFVVGTGQVIPGWDEAVPYFGKGGKGKIYVPSLLGYGPRGAGADIPPYANLVFDVEIKDVTVAPPPAPQAAMPPPPAPGQHH
ncbi:MAG: FKBP-type peptidyl-prolyl cis-trans isomerase [Filimonas sp.]|nr:FKBP-type peptidyl-prolyl cis-trans isomerase [Filimonas sp.]